MAPAAAHVQRHCSGRQPGRRHMTEAALWWSAAVHPPASVVTGRYNTQRCAMTERLQQPRRQSLTEAAVWRPSGHLPYGAVDRLIQGRVHCPGLPPCCTARPQAVACAARSSSLVRRPSSNALPCVGREAWRAAAGKGQVPPRRSMLTHSSRLSLVSGRGRQGVPRGRCCSTCNRSVAAAGRAWRGSAVGSGESSDEGAAPSGGTPDRVAAGGRRLGHADCPAAAGRAVDVVWTMWGELRA